ncbi:MAG TPA: DUF222 domain-containing protein [Longimicrobiales bacterium]|nr:DUF222 domain-containing protein [Longimicrobiales bacterium]
MVHFASTTPCTAVAEAAQAATARDAGIAELERLGEEIATLAAHVHAATYQLLELLAEFDARVGWSGSGFRSCAHWLSWRTGIAPGAAREKVRVARALRGLPKTAGVMKTGELSFAKVRAITRVATADNEAELLEVARNATAAQVEKIVRAWRRVDRLEEQDAERARHESRHLAVYIDDDGMYVVRGRLDPEAGALLERALEMAGETLYARRPDSFRRSDAILRPDDAPQPDAAQQRADALGLVAEMVLAGVGDSRRPAFEVTVHVEADALRTPSIRGHAVIAGGARVSAETSRRIACDASRVVMTCDAAGKTLDVGRRTRAVPPAVRRALAHRDRTCRFPGCDLRFCDAHHIVHWADGGVTSLDNLVLLCRRHHRAVHEDGFTVRGDHSGVLHFHRPDGRVLPAVPAVPVPASDIVTANTRRGVTVDDRSLVSFASGAPLDIDLAVLMLRGASAVTYDERAEP